MANLVLCYQRVSGRSWIIGEGTGYQTFGNYKLSFDVNSSKNKRSFSQKSFLAFSSNIPESSDPIKIVINDWTGQHVSTKLAGEVLG